MPVFAILANRPTQQLERHINDAFSERMESVYKISDTQFLISSDTTAKLLTERLKLLEDKEVGSFLVLSISNYYGRNSPDIWEWFRTKMESSNL